MPETTAPTRGDHVCEECGANGAKATRVRFVDELRATPTLCDSCVDEFEAGVLVEHTSRVEVA